MISSVYLNAVIGNIITFVAGTALTWTSPTLPKLNETDSSNPIGTPISPDENSWISSLTPLGAVFGPFIFGYAADVIGRKYTLLSLGIPFLIANVTLAFAQIVPLFYVARVIVGVAVGGVFTVIPMYLGEIAENSNRGAISSLMNLLLCFGLFMTYCLGPWISIMAFNLVTAVLPAIFMVLFFFFSVETPHYYFSKSKYDEAEKSLHRLRGANNPNNKVELEDIRTTVEKAGKGTIADLFKSKGVIKAFIISLALVTFQQFSGINAVLFYAQSIFQASGSSLKPEISSIIIGGVQFGTSFITPVVSDRLGRKFLLYVSAVGMVVSEVPLGVYFFLKSRGDNVDNISFLPIVCLVLYIIFYNFGFGPLPWSIMGELFPSHVKSIASSCTAAFCWFLAFLITKFFQSVVDSIGMGQSFWIFAGFCVAAFFFTLFVVIETKGKSFQEIQDTLES